MVAGGSCIAGRQLMKVGLRAIAVILAIAMSTWFSFETHAGAQGGGGAQSAAPTISGKVYQFEQIADGIYYATSSGPMAAGGNHPIIINDRDVLLVDDGTTPAAARGLLQDMKLITDKPVRWVVNTHFHYDHTDGNSVFGRDVEIIGHEYVRHTIADLDVIHREPLKSALTNMPIQIESLKKQLGAAKDPAQRATLEKQLAATQADLEELKTLKPTPPTMSYSSKMTLFVGQREIQLLFLRRAPTHPATVLFLPKEKIVCTGDLM